MKKAVCLVTIIVILVPASHGQNWNEWTRQKKTQIKYLQQQLAAAMVYSDYLLKGYTVAKSGLNMIGEIKGADLGLHRQFFETLKKVNPRIGKSSQAAAVVVLYATIQNESKFYIRQLQVMKQFSTEEMAYCESAFERLQHDCVNILDHLFLLLTDDELAMHDHERMKRIARLYADMQSHYGFCTSFGKDMLLLAVQRQADHQDVTISKIINDVK